MSIFARYFDGRYSQRSVNLQYNRVDMRPEQHSNMPYKPLRFKGRKRPTTIQLPIHPITPCRWHVLAGLPGMQQTHCGIHPSIFPHTQIYMLYKIQGI